MREFSRWTGVPVFTADRRSFPAAGSAYFSTGDHHHHGPYIMIRRKYVRQILASLKASRVSLAQGAAWTILANEYNHATGNDRTDIGGFTGGMRNWPATRRAMLELMAKAKVPQAKQERLLRFAKQSMGTLRIPPEAVAPQTPVEPGPPPTIGL